MLLLFNAQQKSFKYCSLLVFRIALLFLSQSLIHYARIKQLVVSKCFTIHRFIFVQTVSCWNVYLLWLKYVPYSYVSILLLGKSCCFTIGRIVFCFLFGMIFKNVLFILPSYYMIDNASVLLVAEGPRCFLQPKFSIVYFIHTILPLTNACYWWNHAWEFFLWLPEL